MGNYTIYDTPPENLDSEQFRKLANFLVRRKVRLLCALTFIIAATGVAHAATSNNLSVLSRYGSLVICLGLMSAAYQLQYTSTLKKVESINLKIFTDIELDKGNGELSELGAKAIAYKRVNGVMPSLIAAVNARLIAFSLAITAIGTLYGSFMDLVISAIR
jgi:hypothetical protein